MPAQAAFADTLGAVGSPAPSAQAFPRPLLTRTGRPAAVAPRAADRNWQPRSIPINSNARIASGRHPAVLQASSGVTAEKIPEHIDLGFDRGMDTHYTFGEQLGKGGNGVVRLVTNIVTGERYACKSIRKVLTDASEKKRAGHLDSLRREVEALRTLGGSLNVVRLVDVYEDEHCVHIIQEWCKGGELIHRIGKRHYSERTVASYMRAVLRTLAQCHAHHILHRDIKPENFMLLDDSERAPLKAIDFGLAVPYDPQSLPRSDLGLEGTPWYMAPEVLSSQVTPASDLWSAGVMAHQLLTGRLPFDDQRNPMAPSLSAVWRSVLTDNVNFNMPWWDGVSDEAKDFVHMLLNRDPTQRPTARGALSHPWLRGTSAERSMGKQMDGAVVQRIQRFGLGSRFKRSVLQMIAQELLAASVSGGAASAASGHADHAGAQQHEGRQQLAILDPSDKAMQDIFDKLHFTGDFMAREDAASALAALGFRLQPCELQRIVEQVDTSNSGRVRRAALAASQIDWRALQQAGADAWLDIARRAFSALDVDADGSLSVADIVGSLRAKLPDDELRTTIRRAMEEAGQAADAQAMDFEGFVRMLKVGSLDSLDAYDDRMLPSPGSVDRLNSLLQAGASDSSHHGSDAGSSHAGSSHGPGRGAAGVGVHPPPAADAKVDAADKPWARPQVQFNFDFGTGWQRGAADAAKPSAPATPAPTPEHSPVPTGAGAANSAATFFRREGAVHGGQHFDKRMHGAHLYRNAVVQRTAPGAPHVGSKRLAPVRE